jgi:hypothetical protein
LIEELVTLLGTVSAFDDATLVEEFDKERNVLVMVVMEVVSITFESILRELWEERERDRVRAREWGIKESANLNERFSCLIIDQSSISRETLGWRLEQMIGAIAREMNISIKPSHGSS